MHTLEMIFGLILSISLFGLVLLTFCGMMTLIIYPIAEVLRDIVILILILPIVLVIWIFNRIKEALNGK